MADTLGCESHLVQVIDQGGASLGNLDGITSLTWERRRNEVSLATVVLAGTEVSEACCQVLGAMRPWRHELRVIRGGEVVWTGPVMEMDLGADESTVVAYDHAIWLDRRIIHEPVTYTEEDVVSIAEQVVGSAMIPDEPGILELLYPIERSEPLAEYTIEGNSQTALEILNALAIFGLSWTMVMGRLFLSSHDCIGSIGSLDDRYVDGMRVVDSGLDAFTSATVTGSTTEGTAVVGSADGDNLGYYGRLEKLVLDDDVTSNRFALDIAQRLVADNPISPVVIRTESGLGLLPEAPFDINELIPGVCVTANSSQTCRAVTQEIQLLSLVVSEEHDTEAIHGTFGPPGVNVDRQVT